MRALALICGLALASCASHTVDVGVSEPKVFGDDMVLRMLAEQRQRLGPLASGIRPGDYQESFVVRRTERSRTTLGLNLSDPGAAPPTPPAAGGERARRRRPLPWVRRGLQPGVFYYPPPLQPGLTFEEQLRQRVHASRLLSTHGLLLHGSTRLLDRKSRAALLRFDLSFNTYADLGGRRQFTVVEFVVRPKRRDAPRFSVYLLSPEYSAMVSHEQSLNRLVSQHALQLLGSWGGIGVTGSHGETTSVREDFEALLETPLQFAVYDSREVEGGGKRFAFAFGPRRRLNQRSVLNPARWFGSNHKITYELQPGPRTCEALLVFEDVTGGAPVELEVSVFADGRLIAEDDVDVSRALRRGQRPVKTFDVRCPPGQAKKPTQTVRVDPGATTDVLLSAGPEGPTFTPESQVFVGSVLLPSTDARVLGRGRVAARVRPHAGLAAAASRGERELSGRVITPDQPDFTFKVELVSAGRQK